MAFNVSYVYRIKDKYSATAKRIRVNTKLINRELALAQKRIKAVNKKLENFNKLGKQLSLKVTTPIVAAGAAAAIMFGNFEEGLGNTLTLLDSSAPDGYAKKLAKIAKGAMKAGFATEETTKSLFDSVSTLGASEAALDAFDVAQTLAIGGASTLTASVTGLTAIMNAYGRETTNAKDIAGVFFSAQKGGATDVQRLGTNIGKVASIAKDAGVDIDTLMGTVAQLTLTAPSTEIAITQLRGAINAITKPSKEAEKILKDKGIAFNTVKLRADGLIPTLEKLARLSKTNPNLLTKMIPELEARAGISALGVEQIANLKNILAGIASDRKNNTGLTDAYTKKNKEFNKSMARMGGSIKVAAIAMGAVMAPVIKQVAGFIAAATDKFVKFSEAHPKITKLVLVVAGLAAVLGPIVVMAGLAGAAIAAISVPVLLIAAQIALVGVAIASVIAFWGELTQIGNETIDFWSSFFGGGSSDINVNGPGSSAGGGVASKTLTNNARIDGNINVNAAPGTVSSVQSNMTGANIGGLGLNMAGAGG